MQVDVRGNTLLHVEHGLHGQQARVAGVHMAADGQQAACHGPVAVGQGTLHQGLVRELGFELAPQRDAFEQGAAFVHAWHAVAERGVHVEVRVDKRRGQQQALGVHHLVCRRLQAFGHFGDLAALHGNGHALPAIGQRGIGDEEIEHFLSFLDAHLSKTGF
ncbi:hypothetical protein D3C71_1751530 [compost metagenome]